MNEQFVESLVLFGGNRFLFLVESAEPGVQVAHVMQIGYLLRPMVNHMHRVVCNSCHLLLGFLGIFKVHRHLFTGKSVADEMAGKHTAHDGRKDIKAVPLARLNPHFVAFDKTALRHIPQVRANGGVRHVFDFVDVAEEIRVNSVGTAILLNVGIDMAPKIQGGLLTLCRNQLNEVVRLHSVFFFW